MQFLYKIDNTQHKKLKSWLYSQFKPSDFRDVITSRKCGFGLITHCALAGCLLFL